MAYYYIFSLLLDLFLGGDAEIIIGIEIEIEVMSEVENWKERNEDMKKRKKIMKNQNDQLVSLRSYGV